MHIIIYFKLVNTFWNFLCKITVLFSETQTNPTNTIHLSSIVLQKKEKKRAQQSASKGRGQLSGDGRHTKELGKISVLKNTSHSYIHKLWFNIP